MPLIAQTDPEPRALIDARALITDPVGAALQPASVRAAAWMIFANSRGIRTRQLHGTASSSHAPTSKNIAGRKDAGESTQINANVLIRRRHAALTNNDASGNFPGDRDVPSGNEGRAPSEWEHDATIWSDLKRIINEHGPVTAAIGAAATCAAILIAALAAGM